MFLLTCIVGLMKLFIRDELNKTTIAIASLVEQGTNQSRTLSSISERLAKLEGLPLRMVEFERDVSTKLSQFLPRQEFQSHLERHFETERRIHERLDAAHGIGRGDDQ
jgi:hypothetical protein